MRILFVHQNMPGQYKHLARVYAARPGTEVAFVTKPNKPDLPGVRRISYQSAPVSAKGQHSFLTGLEDQVLHGEAVARTLEAEKKKGFTPDVICAHSGWGEALYLKDVYPDAKLLVYCEFYYRSSGADVGFNPIEGPDLTNDCRLRTRNAHMVMSLIGADWGISPTRWQWSVHPAELRRKISVVFDGVDTDVCKPDPTVSFRLPSGRVLTREDEVVTYIARNLEAYRGFPQFMKAIEIVQKRRPKAVIVVVGGDKVSYGKHPVDAMTYREAALRDGRFDATRLHFLGHLPYDAYLRVVRLSRVHTYLTYPFVLSWSMMESMGAGALIIGSATPPVEEVLEDGVNGRLADFFDVEALADKICDTLERHAELRHLREAARRTVLERYDLRRVCLPAQQRLIDTLVSGGLPEPGPLVSTPSPIAAG